MDNNNSSIIDSALLAKNWLFTLNGKLLISIIEFFKEQVNCL